MLKHNLMIATLLALSLGACGGKSEADADLAEVEASMAEQSGTAASAPAPAVQATAEVQPVLLAENAIAVGSALAPSGAVAAAKPVYATGDTVYVSVPTAGHSAGAEVVIFWFGPSGTAVKEERKAVAAGAQFVNFSLGRAEGLTAGAFMAQVDVAGQPLGMADFTVR